jgi:hypothetical protein
MILGWLECLYQRTLFVAEGVNEREEDSIVIFNVGSESDAELVGGET